ncbi:phosphotransferase enzyme family protein [Pseudoalteromonas denitrificans]|uniref:Phosphotransferase enzyme family protein n=1 Tax=Pseudoalteromonas denitrificans DSM 6059 TaxID=1123010 RepID=A0A1I1L5E1_9GAMM|nr:aminoglycoside phosphotransferase family protein [Pseudoalteromonas denitrificans]SFC67742.1 Phosphotransferase enzyme family protein [Pseudoalteromonas denitrificans DSM 6059]
MYQEQAKILSEYFGLNTSSEAKEVTIKPIGNGHINTTLLLQGTKSPVVVQKLNTYVFPELNELVNNARLIERHLENKKNSNNYKLDIIKHVATTEQKYLVDINGDNWRALEFIGGSYSEDVVINKQQAKIAANAFGQFAAALEDFDAKKLFPVIPDFHHLAKRIEALKSAVNLDKHDRLSSAQDQVDFCLGQEGLVEELELLKTKLPLRACHNDTKINNMLFCSKKHNAKAVIDLDTCMSGYWLFDFGDMVRTFCSPEEEDSTNLDNVVIREDIFEAIVEGYVTPLKNLITHVEKQSFWVGAKVMCLMIGVRFLTDYLDGDNYFCIKRAGHNLDRAKNQFALYQDLLKKEGKLKALLD